MARIEIQEDTIRKIIECNPDLSDDEVNFLETLGRLVSTSVEKVIENTPELSREEIDILRSNPIPIENLKPLSSWESLLIVYIPQLDEINDAN